MRIWARRERIGCSFHRPCLELCGAEDGGRRRRQEEATRGGVGGGTWGQTDGEVDRGGKERRMDGGRGVVLTDLRYQSRNKATQGRTEKKQMSELNRILRFKSNPINSRFLIKSLIRCLVSQHRRHFFPSHIFFPMA